MLRKIVATIAIAAVFVAGGVAAFYLTNENASQGDKPTVSASFYPLYDFTKQVGGDRVNVTNMTPPGAEPHDFEPSPKDLAQAHDSEIFVYSGGSMEPWASGFLADYKGEVIKADEGVALLHAGDDHDDDSTHMKGGVDPHFWLDPVAAQQIVRTIRDGLVRIDPENEKYYETNAEEYIRQLDELDKRFAEGLLRCTLDTAISSHGAFSYLAHRYSFNVISIAGIEPDDEPSPAKMAELTDIVKQKGIRYIFFESLVSPRLAETIADEAGVGTLVFNPIEGLSKENQDQGKDYISIQYDNLENLRKALDCK